MKRLLLVLALVSCGGTAKDYSAKKLVTETVTTGGISYTIDIPEGLPRDDRDPTDWSNAKEEYDEVPKVFTGLYPLDMPANEEDVRREASLRPKDANFVRTTKNADGWSVTDANADKHRVEATSFKKLGDKIVKCTAVQVTSGELPSYEATKTMLEKICDSVKAK